MQKVLLVGRKRDRLYNQIQEYTNTYSAEIIEGQTVQ